MKNHKNPVIGVGTLNINRRAKELVLETLNHNRLSYGPLTERFEARFAHLHNCRFGVMSNSGTSALQIALQAMKEMHGWADGSEVIIPAVTFVATANIVLHNRMRPVPVDVDPIYYGLDPNLLQAKITPNTRAIIPVHPFGQPADMQPIRQIALHYGLKIIEDSAETMFASYNGQPVGSLGDIGCFSTYVAHLLVTGVGGLNTTNDPEYAVRLRSLLNHGRDSIYISIDDDDNKSHEELRLVVARRFNFVAVGHSFRATEMEAALGLAQLEEWEAFIAARRTNARQLTRQLAHLESQLQLPQIRPGSDHSFMMFPIVLRHQPKVALVNFLEQHGVETRDMLPLISQPVYQALGWNQADYPVARWINQNGFYVGCHQDLTMPDLNYITELFEHFFQHPPLQPHRGGCLIVAAQDSTNLAQDLETIPLNLFERVLVVTPTPLPADVLTEYPQLETATLAASGPLEMVIAGQLKIEQDNLVFFAADGRYNPHDAGRLLLALERGYDMAVASRFIVGGGRNHPDQMSSYRSVGNRIFTLFANLLFYGNLSDSLSQFRAVKQSKLRKMALTGKGLPLHYRLSIRAMKQGWRVTEIPVTEIVSSNLKYWQQVALSILPTCLVLLSEWWQPVESE